MNNIVSHKAVLSPAQTRKSLKRSLRKPFVLAHTIAVAALGFLPLGVQAQSLEALIDGAVHQHPTMRAGELGVRAAEADLEGAKQALYPSFSASSSAGQLGQSASNSTTLSIKQPIWVISGTQLPKCEASAVRAVGAAWGAEESRENVVMRVLTAYASWLRAAERVDISKNDIAYYDTLMEQIKRRVDSGASAQVEMDVVRSRRNSSQRDLLSNQSSEAIAIAQLEHLSGLKPKAPSMREAVAQPVVLTKSMSELEYDATANYPTLMRIDKEIEALRFDRETLKQSAMPQLYVQAAHTFGDAVESSKSSSVYMGLSWEPGAGLSTLSAMESVAQRAEGLRASRDAARLDLLDKVRTNFLQLGSAVDQLQLQEHNIKALETVRDSYLRQFLAGRRAWQEVMNAARDVSEAKNAAADLKTQILASGYSIDYWIGGKIASIAEVGKAVTGANVSGICWRSQQ